MVGWTFDRKKIRSDIRKNKAKLQTLFAEPRSVDSPSFRGASHV